MSALHTLPRLYVEAPLAADGPVVCEREQAHYLLNVMRLKAGEQVRLFNGRDGEWLAEAQPQGKRDLTLLPLRQTREQTGMVDLHYCFAPLKQARLDYMVQKAVEMGASLLQPVITRHCQVPKVNGERLRANAIEAAEQCNLLGLPQIGDALSFERWLAARESDRLLIVCDEGAPLADPLAALAPHKGASKLAVLIGPEGGFAAEERVAFQRQPNVLILSLGPRIMRADTAAVAALALVQAVLGDLSCGG